MHRMSDVTHWGDHDRAWGLLEPGWSAFVAARRRFLTDRAFETLVRSLVARGDPDGPSESAGADPLNAENGRAL